MLFLAFALQVGRQLWRIRHASDITPQQFSAATIDTSIRSIANKEPSSSLVTLDDPGMGTERSPILTIVSFVDFSCPYSAQTAYMVQALQTLLPRVRFLVRDFPIADVHPQAALAAEASQCAHEQGKYFAYYDKLFREQDNLGEEALRRFAREIGLDGSLFDSCLASHRYAAEVAADRQDGIAAGVRATPTFFFNGVRLEGAVPEPIFHQLVAGVLEQGNR
jgi:protein-disulfide isomerase